MKKELNKFSTSGLLGEIKSNLFKNNKIIKYVLFWNPEKCVGYSQNYADIWFIKGYKLN